MRRGRMRGRPVSFVGFLLILALLAVNACDSGAPAIDSTTGPSAGPESGAPEVGPANGGVTTPPTASPFSSEPAISTVSIDGPEQPTSGRPDALLSFAWTPSPHGSAVLGVSADGRTIGIAETPERTGIGNLHLFDDHGTALLARPFAVSMPHDSPFIALADLAVVSPDTLYLLLQHKWTDFRVHRLTPNDTGMSTESVHLPASSAYDLALADDEAELWAYDPDGDRSYPVFAADGTVLDGRQQRAGTRDGFPVGDVWAAVRLEAASVDLEAVGREAADAWAGWHVRLVSPDGYEVISAAPLTLADNGLLYLLVRIHSVERSFEDDLVTILALDSAGAKRGQLTLHDDSLRQAARFDMTRDATLYGLWSTPGLLEVRTYTVPVTLSGPDGSDSAAAPAAGASTD